MTGLRFETYDWAGGREAMLRFGPDSGPIVLAALPLFEEANRTRQFLVTILRALAVAGIGSVLPDMPGTGESIIATYDARLLDQQVAFTTLTEQLGMHTYSVAIRSAALLGAGAPLAGRWHMTPQTGEDLLRDLHRARSVVRSDAEAQDEYMGNRLSTAMLADLRGATPDSVGRRRIVRLDTDPRPADAHYAGSPLWRRAEPDNDVPLAQRLAADISAWIAACER